MRVETDTRGRQPGETGARLVAEGVEVAEREALLTRGVRYGQGFQFGRSRPAADVVA